MDNDFWLDAEQPRAPKGTANGGQWVKTYSVVGKGSVGPAHPMYDPRATAYLKENGKDVGSKTLESGKEAHRYALEMGYRLPPGDPRENSEAYQALLAEIRYKVAGLDSAPESRFSDSAPVTSMKRTSDGYLTGSVRCARTGVQDYLRTELGLEGDGMIAVYRPEASVFDAASLKTYAGKPITMNHPKGGVVDAANWKELSIGTVGSKVLRDGESIVVDFAIMDADAVAGIEAGTRQVSMGYTTPMVLQDGVAPDGTPYQAVQTGPIKINHLAVVPAARGGKELRIGDAAICWGATPIHHGDKEMSMSTKSVVLGDSAVMLPIADAGIVEAFKASMVKQLSDAFMAKKKVEEDKDEEIGKLKAEKKKLEDAAITPARLSAMIADRVALEQKVKVVDAKIVCDGVSDDDLRKAAVISVLGDSAVADSSASEISGMFKAITVTAPNDSVRSALGSGKFIDSAVSNWSDSVAAAAGVKFKKGA